MGGLRLHAPIERLLVDSDAVDAELAGRLQRLRDRGRFTDANLDRVRRLAADGGADDVRAFATLLEGEGTYARALADLDASDVSAQRVNLVNRRLVRAVSDDAMSSGDASRLLGDVRDASSDGRDVTGLFEDDATAEALVRTYDASPSAGPGTLRAIDDFDASNRQTFLGFLERTGDDGFRLVGDLDPDHLEQFVRMDEALEGRGFTAVSEWRTTVARYHSNTRLDASKTGELITDSSDNTSPCLESSGYPGTIRGYARSGI